jgi:hypothetical protein
MKKKIIFLLMLSIIWKSNGQNVSPYYDAKFIRENCYDTIGGTLVNKSTLMATLKKYYPNQDVEENLLQIIKSNPFFKQYAPSGFSSGSSPILNNNFSFSSIGSTNVTSFADGLAKFLIKRSKQELLVSFFEKIPEFEKNYPEFTIIFPNTTVLINSFKSWEYANILNTLREAFDKDLKELLINLPKIISVDTNSEIASNWTPEACNRIIAYQTFLNSEKGIAISSSLLIGSQFLSGNKLPDIINNVASKEKLEKINLNDKQKEKEIKSALAFIRIISNSLRSNDVNKSYITSIEIKDLFKDPITANIFFGLLYQQMQNESIEFNGYKVSDFLKITNIDKASLYIQNFVDQSILVSEAIKKLKEDKMKPDANLDDDWAAIFQAVNNFIPTITNVEIIDSRIKFPDGIQQIVEKSQFATTVAHDIAIKNYNAAIVGILRELSDNNTNEEFKEFKTFFVKYGSFAANVVEAKNSEEVEEAIESVALPVGSASIKKKTCFNIALNAYLGGFWGNEYLADKATENWAPISGVYAPVGIAFSWGINQAGTGYKFADFFFKGFSISALINIIDIGAVASYRLQDPDTEDLPEFELKNILAPGLGLVYGFPTIPLSIGYTYQLGPTLRNITSSEAINSSQMNKRWQFFIGVDIPIFNFYTKSK